MRKKDKFNFYLSGIIAPYFLLFAWFIGIQVLFFAFTLISLIPIFLLDFLSVPKTILEIFVILIGILYLIIILIFLPISEIKILRISYRKQLKKYKSNGGKLSPRIIKKLTISYWIISFLFWLAFLIAIVIPAFENVKANPPSTAVQNGLVNGIKECVVRDSDDKTTNFLDAQSFSSSNFTGFEIKPLNINSCFQAKAIPKVKFKNVNTWFEIKMNTATGEVAKKCGDQSKRGCNKGNTW